MGAAGMFRQTSELLSGRWQIPLALIAAVVAGATLYNLIPERSPIDLNALLADVTVLEEAGDRLAAVDAVANLLAVELDPPLRPSQKATLHHKLAELIFSAERDAPTHNVNNLNKLLQNQRAAEVLGHPTTPKDTWRAAFAHHWLGQGDEALQTFRRALELDLTVDDRRAALLSLVQILERRPEAKLERRRVLRQLLAEESVPPPYLWWGLHHAVQDALDEHDTLRARELLTQHGDRLKSSDLKGYLDWLQALVMFHEGRLEEAAPLVQWVDDWLGSDARTTRELDRFGHLPSLNRWLMGRIHLREDRPQEALAAFDDVLQNRPDPDLLVTATVGRGLALAALNRHAAALETFRGLPADLADTSPQRRLALAEFREALLSLFEQQYVRENDPEALPYLALAAKLTPDSEPDQQLELLEQLGRAYRVASRRAADEQQSSAYHDGAGRALEAATQRAEFDEVRLADLLWLAAEEYDQAGRIADMRRVLRQFIEGRSEHPRMPQALLRMGQACEAFGELEEALAWFERVVDKYPRLEQASRAKLLAAGVQISLGESRYTDAERVLAELLTSDFVAPQAPVYRDALLTLCSLLYHQGRHAETISRLQDFLTLYPEDPERLRACFTLADAYRRSACQLRDEPPAGPAGASAAAESQQRFRRAADLFSELLTDLEEVSQPGDAERLYARLALFYRGDCLFELNEPETLRAALATYRNAAARYNGQPAALTAQVQVANVLLRQGDVGEATCALERARWLLRGIPEEAFARFDGGRRENWERFLAVVSSSDLFQRASNEAP